MYFIFIIGFQAIYIIIGFYLFRFLYFLINSEYVLDFIFAVVVVSKIHW